MLEQYCQFVDIDGGKICVKVDGESEKVIVLLHGAFLVVSPILELKPLVVLLKNDFTVVTIEYFGYGLSDKTEKERTIESITSEIHEVLHKLGLNKYYFLAHSLSGVYCLYYMNKYPNEVEGFIGIDTSVPRQNEVINTGKVNLNIAYLLRLLNRIGVFRLFFKLLPKSLVNDVRGYEYSKEELEELCRLYCINIANRTVINELTNCAENFQKALGMKYPKSIPVLFFLANRTSKQIKQWYDLHSDLLENKENSKIVTLDGFHALYRQHSKEIVEIFQDFKINVG